MLLQVKEKKSTRLTVLVGRVVGRFLPDSASDHGILKKRQADSWGRKSLAQNSTDRLFGVVRPEAEGGEGNKKAQ